MPAAITWMARLARRLRLLARLDSAERSMHDEMHAHLEFDVADRIARGASPDAARTAALRDFGAIEAHKEAGRDARGTRVVEDLLRDVAYAVRMFAHHRAFAASVILTFALGIGAAAAIFSIVYGVLLRPLPYAAPGELVALWEHNLPRANDRNVVSVVNFERWRERASSFDSMAALVPAPVTLPSPDGPERVVGAEVSPELFGLLGVRPMLGRDFTRADRGPVVMLSERYWRTRLGADPSVVGRMLAIEGRPHADGRAHEIIGVMPAGFEPPAYGWLGEQALWVPFIPGPENRWYGRYLLVIGRLRPGVGVGEARAELAGIAAAVEREDAANAGWSANVVPLAGEITGDVRDALIFILGTALLLFTLAVTNVATLLAAHLRRRVPELALRHALGATDGRVRRQVLVECLLIGMTGSLAGLALAYPLVGGLRTLLPADVPRTAGIGLGPTVWFAALATGVLGSLFIGMASLRAARRAPSGLLRDGSARVTRRAGGRTLVVAEVTIGLVVAVFAGLVLRSFVGLRAVDLGFDTDGVAVARVAIGTDYDSAAAQGAFFDGLLERIRRQPGILDAGLMSGTPLRGTGPATTVRDVRSAAAKDDLIADARWADAQALIALDVRLTAGTLFDGTDRPGGPVRIVVTSAMARALWPGERAVGQRAHISLFNGLEATVIGVVDDIRFASPRMAPRAAFFLAPRRFPSEAYDVIVRADGPPATVFAGMRGALAALDPGVPLHRAETLDAVVARSLARDRFTATLLSAFALLALLLASVGIYGVVAADVGARRKEIGIRLALGARAERVVLGLLGDSAVSAALGITIGITVAAALSRWVEGLLFGISPTDGWSYAGAGACLAAVAIVATLIPALQASRVSPLTSLRE